jgi:hypothetical protein
MEHEIFQAFLDAEPPLINLEQDDESDKLKTSINHLKEEILNEHSKVIPYVLTSLFKKGECKNTIRELNVVIVRSWSTFKSNSRSNDNKLTIIRAIILDCLNQLLTEDDDVANLIWLTIQSEIENIPTLIDKESKIEKDFVEKTRKIQSEIVSKKHRWSFDDRIIKEEVVEEEVVEAIEAIEEFVEEETDIEILERKFQQFIDISTLRSQILWWNKSLYSTSQKTTYRKIDYILLPIIIAYDLSQIVPFIYPESVDYLLRETIKEAKKEVNTINLKEWLGQIKTRQADLEKVIKSKATTYDRILLLDFIQEQCAVEDMEKRLGIEDAELTLEDLAVWLFHNFQVQNYLDNGTK